MHRDPAALAGDLTEFNGGATRSSDADAWRFDLIPASPMRRVAAIFAEGCKTHGANNWRGGVPASVVMNHLEGHLNAYKGGDATEDHLAKVAVNALMLLWYEDHKPETLDLPDRQLPKGDDCGTKDQSGVETVGE